MIGKVAVSAANYAIDKPYSYVIPEQLTVKPGMRVQVSFGRGNRSCEGIVLSTEEGSSTGLKSIEQVLDEEPVLDDRMLHLAAFIRQRCYCSFYEAARAMLPAGLWFRTSNRFSLTEDRSWQEKQPRQKEAALLLQILLDCGGQTTDTILREAVADEEAFDRAIGYLLRKKYITAQVDFSRRMNDRTEKIAILASSAEEAMEYAASRPKSALHQRHVLETLCSVGSASVKELCYYTGAKPATVNRLAELGYVTLAEREVLRYRQIKPAQVTKPLVLSEEQNAAFQGLKEQLQKDDPGAALLYGVTGSGKTSVYIRLIQECLDQGKQAVLLVPEIALTPQLLGVMAAWFGDQVAVLHSSLPATERYDQWKRIRSGQGRVVVGTRSAVFAPCPDLGLLILDEEQEHSYKSDNTPRYSAREVALWRGYKEHALVLMGSATPSVETMYMAKTGTYKLYKLPNRWGGKKLPEVQIVDMKEQLRDGNLLSVSYALTDAIGQTAEAGQQTVLFLNRRGNARALQCVQCGSAPECPRCSARLTYHSANERLMCHYCGHSEPVLSRCPSCGGQMKRVGTGTQKVQQELQELFPDMKVLRMDTDTVSAANTHEQILDQFQKEKVPVLLGTQMVAKGLNLPNVTLVGVLDADLGLYTSNFRAHETAFNMLTQVVGRAGRGEVAGRAMIQTFVPEHQVITLAAKQDYEGFYEQELQMRRVQNCPPLADETVITFTGPDEARVLRGAEKFRSSLQKLLDSPPYNSAEYVLLGPAPCPVAKINYNFRYRLTLRCRLDNPLRQLLGHLLRQFGADKENRTVSAFIDVNGYD